MPPNQPIQVPFANPNQSTKKWFMMNFVLAKVSRGDVTISGEEIAKEAIKAWKIIEKSDEEEVTNGMD